MDKIAGVDEAGRGPLAGNVVAAAVILDPNRPIDGLDDSKKLSEKKRIGLDIEIREHALSWAIGKASVEEIDDLNILHATMLAMARAVKGLTVIPSLVRIDGNRVPDIPYDAIAVVGGDALHAEISAASIIAKQARDREMVELSMKFPNYGFDKHKGYPTRAHIAALEKFGVTKHHRQTFAPVRNLLTS
jgi:ribonuclease HII